MFLLEVGGEGGGGEDVKDNEVARDGLRKKRPVCWDRKQQLWQNKGVLTGLETADSHQQLSRLQLCTNLPIVCLALCYAAMTRRQIGDAP